jgi:hypothetical protein
VGWGGGATCSGQAATAKSTSGASAAVEQQQQRAARACRCLAGFGEANNARHARRERPRVQRTPLGAEESSCSRTIAAWTMTAQRVESAG